MDYVSRTPTVKCTQALLIVHLNLENVSNIYTYIHIYIYIYRSTGYLPRFCLVLLFTFFHELNMISNLKNISHLGKTFKFT